MTFAPATSDEPVKRPFDAPTTVDSSVTQGNRLTTAERLIPTSPQALLEAKIDEGFRAGMNLLAELRSGADKLEELLNKLRVGF